MIQNQRLMFRLPNIFEGSWIRGFVRLELWGEAKIKEESESDDQFNVSLELEAVTILTQASLC